jgi:hypothetical protein
MYTKVRIFGYCGPEVLTSRHLVFAQTSALPHMRLLTKSFGEKRSRDVWCRLWLRRREGGFIPPAGVLRLRDTDDAVFAQHDELVYNLGLRSSHTHKSACLVFWYHTSTCLNFANFESNATVERILLHMNITSCCCVRNFWRHKTSAFDVELFNIRFTA